MINNIVLQNIRNSISIYCGDYEKLKSIFLSISKENILLEVSFPLFNKTNNIIFKSLVFFHFESNEKSIISYQYDVDDDDDDEYNQHIPDFDILENLNYFLDNMPNLKTFYFSFGFFNPMNKKTLFLKAANKVLSLKSIKSIYFSIYKIGENSFQFYSKNELEVLFPNINFNTFYEINISKIGIFI